MYRNFLKRLFDFLGALLLLPFVFLLVVIIAPFIYFYDYGPIFYMAKRSGKKGKQFSMFKLRTMYVDAPDIRNEDGSTYNSDNDPRVTPMGRFLRKTSLDEFPQFINVLIGDMSFIGPRPIINSQSFEEFDNVHRIRSLVRPGITGYAQAYFRNSISQDEKFKYDCYYAQNLSFIMDVSIVLKTIVSVLFRKNINKE